VDIEAIRKRVKAGKYLVKSHAIKEGFDRKHMIEAITSGGIIEEYPDDRRALICGQTRLDDATTVYLHVVCEYTDPVYVELITAYLPDETWENPPVKRRKPKRN
jgi:hypothetical protein